MFRVPVLMILAGSSLAMAADEPTPRFWRCVVHGRVIYQDTACNPDPDDYVPKAPAPPGPDFSQVAPGAALGAGQESPLGAWRGQTQYQGSESGQNVSGSQSVVALEMNLSHDGRVTGTSPANGCRLLGVWEPGGTPRRVALDVTLSGCSYQGYNRRYSGSLLTAGNEHAAQLALQGYDVGPGRPPRLYDVKATLRR